MRAVIDIRTIIHLTPEVALGYWYLFETYTMIRFYGFNGEPYMLPSFMTSRIFSLEFIRQKLHYDITHFSKDKQLETFQLPQEVKLFGVRGKETPGLVGNMLKEMGFDKDTKWKYDPRYIITRMKRTKKGKQGFHEKNELLEKVANKMKWEEVRDILQATKYSKKEATSTHASKELVDM